MDADRMHRLTDALEQLRRLRQVLEGVRVHELASLNAANRQQYYDSLRKVDTALSKDVDHTSAWGDGIQLLGLPQHALSFMYIEESHGQLQLPYGTPDAWSAQFMVLSAALHTELSARTGILIVSGYSDDEMTRFFNGNARLCQQLAQLLRHVYDWTVLRTDSPHKQTIQESADWCAWFTVCVWIATRTPDPSCHTLYTHCLSAENTLQQEMQDSALQHFLHHKSHYLPKVPTPPPKNPDDMHLGSKMPSTPTTPLHVLLRRLLASA